MKRSKPGRSVYLEKVGIWLEDDGSIHLTAEGIKGFHTTINNVPDSDRCHRNLYMKFAKCLKEAGAPYPEIVDRSG